MKILLAVVLLALGLFGAGCSKQKQEAATPSRPKTEAQLAAEACYKAAFAEHLQASQVLLKESMAVLSGGGDASPYTLLLRHEKEVYCMRRVDCFGIPSVARSAFLESCLEEEV
ncbi:MAG: hypothetical protein ABIK08_04120 [Pseudomonadota bacterium]